MKSWCYSRSFIPSLKLLISIYDIDEECVTTVRMFWLWKRVIDLGSKEIRNCHHHHHTVLVPHTPCPACTCWLVPTALCSEGQRGTILCSCAAQVPQWGLLCTPCPTAMSQPRLCRCPGHSTPCSHPHRASFQTSLCLLFFLCNLVFLVKLFSPSVLPSSLSPPVTMRLLASCFVGECPCHWRGAGDQETCSKSCMKCGHFTF